MAEKDEKQKELDIEHIRKRVMKIKTRLKAGYRPMGGRFMVTKYGIIPPY